MQAAQLVGRRQEIDLVESTLNARVGRGPFLGGQPGVGKTRLAREIAARWAASDRPVEWISAAAASSAIPFGAVIRLLPDVVAGAVESAAPREVELIRRAVGAARLQPERLIVVDDIHQLDGLSALLVHHLVLDGAVPVLMTLRTGEPVASSLEVTDKDGGTDTIVASTYVVVYDPSAGFVTGGGWINSPAGAYAADGDDATTRIAGGSIVVHAK